MTLKRLLSKVLLILGYMAQTAGADTWLCSEQVSERRGKDIYACGVAVENTEAMARGSAFEDASKEFDRICQGSDDCVDHEIAIEPKRSTCEQIGAQYECRRLIVFHIGEPKPHEPKFNWFPDPKKMSW